MSRRAPGLAVVAVRADGRRFAHQPVCDASCDAAALRALVGDPVQGVDTIVLLDHAGPCAAHWSLDRPLGAAAQPEPVTGRTPRALDELGWAEVTRAFVDAAARCRAAGVSWGVALDDDGLLHDALRRAPARALALVEATRPARVSLPVEDLAPRGLDVTDGVALARQLTARGVTHIVASAGTRALAPLRARRKGDTVGGRAALVAAAASAAWLVGRVDATLEAVAPFVDVSEDDVREVARAFGLARIHVERANALPELTP